MNKNEKNNSCEKPVFSMKDMKIDFNNDKKNLFQNLNKN